MDIHCISFWIKENILCRGFPIKSVAILPNTMAKQCSSIECIRMEQQRFKILWYLWMWMCLMFWTTSLNNPKWLNPLDFEQLILHYLHINRTERMLSWFHDVWIWFIFNQYISRNGIDFLWWTICDWHFLLRNVGPYMHCSFEIGVYAFWFSFATCGILWYWILTKPRTSYWCYYSIELPCLPSVIKCK